MPHSRLNDLPSALLRTGGYTNLVESPEMNWTVAVKDQRLTAPSCSCKAIPSTPPPACCASTGVTCSAILRGERPHVPSIPVGYLDAEGRRLLEGFESRVLKVPRDFDLMNEFPFEPVAERLVNTWQSSGTRSVRQLASTDPVQEEASCMTRRW